MKISCDCGNDGLFNPIDERTGEKHDYTEGEGQYVTIKGFSFWESHDVVGIKCDSCGKDVWLFI